MRKVGKPIVDSAVVYGVDSSGLRKRRGKTIVARVVNPADPPRRVTMEELDREKRLRRERLEGR